MVQMHVACLVSFMILGAFVFTRTLAVEVMKPQNPRPKIRPILRAALIGSWAATTVIMAAEDWALSCGQEGGLGAATATAVLPFLIFGSLGYAGWRMGRAETVVS